ncbi:hypothetical protein BCR33DRAFT_744507 [Rhizoclosmatium globosum]|uniref:T6SS Phospholipase effector Tle1-like catalytic domain-containing protein n=1 Tax=Rhizoclosmatium globosum TaxID=329046 RepID=A0A1Y2B9Q1_9FUNG|nr:hypothetical protein BCR33DRAFT_744507 [Rhizoclosmatium globosum]|eukprot:ORY31559.1 hypothetical protein BCR33DRAFT_744507 [Rhizoclosmatium globosum]
MGTFSELADFESEPDVTDSQSELSPTSTLYSPLTNSLHGVRKLVVCVDGTWQHPGTVSDVESMGGVKVTAAMTPSNVVKIAYLAQQLGKESNSPQKIYYHSGVGTEVDDATDRALEGFPHLFLEFEPNRFLLSGAFGNIKEYVVDAYTWLAKEYQPGDEIYAFGFSRGSTVVRSLFSLLRFSGLPATVPKDQDSLNAIVNLHYAHYETRLDRAGKQTPLPQDHIIPTLQFLGVFDTVTALECVGIIEENDYHDMNIGMTVKNAAHAISIDEKRSYFLPTLFEAVPQLPEGLTREQVWFRGDHADIGGGWWEQELSLIPLKWMIDKAREAGLDVRDATEFDSSFVPFLLGASQKSLQSRKNIKVHDYFASLKSESNSTMGKKVSRDVSGYMKDSNKYFPSKLHESVARLGNLLPPAENLAIV